LVAGASSAAFVAVEAVGLVPSVTTPLFVTLYGVAAVCAKA
jgi:hypothetical protein